MQWTKKISNFFLRISLFVLCLFVLSSCDGSGCVDSSQFNEEYSVVEANPINDGVTGVYSDEYGGEIASWHDTGFRSSGDDFLVVIRGAWTTWLGDSGQMSESLLNSLPRCDFCAKKTSNGNCLCYSGPERSPIRYEPEPETDTNGDKLSVNCSVAENQNDLNKCTCTTLQGNATDYGVYHINLNFRDKNEVTKVPDEQSLCRYEAGMGLYIGLFGSSGTNVPLRAYHAFSEEEVCDVTRDSEGRCLDDYGDDLTKYIFRSRNEKIFVKNDNFGNEIEDPNDPTDDDEYHKQNEKVKLIINDGYYSDNYGSYQVTFLRGVAKAGSGICPAGVLECLVSNVEDVIMGEKVTSNVTDENGNQVLDSDGEPETETQREGGVIKFIYNALIQDSGFALLTQIILILYITFYGLATLVGVAEINKKELLDRAMKIALVMLFIGANSWEIYNDIVVKFFVDGMNYVMGFLLDLSDAQYSPTSGIMVAQMDRAVDTSQATRFSYIDTVITRMFSEPVTKKIWGLFLGGGVFGILYIVGIYATILFFLYVMATAAIIYTINLIKLFFGLALGPMFFLFVFFQQTNGMFKKWLAFIGARSLEMIILFLVLYNFILLIDKTFITMLSYKTCFDKLNFGLFSLTILKSYPERSFIEWVTIIGTIAGLTYLMSLIMDKVGSISSSLIDIAGGGSGGGVLSASAKMGNQFMDNAKEFSKDYPGAALKGGAMYGFRGGVALARATGLSELSDNIGKKIPFRGVKSRIRDKTLDGMINNAISKAKSQGLTGLDFDKQVRKNVMADFYSRAYRGRKVKGKKTSPNRFALFGIDPDNLDPIINRLDKKLIHDRTKDFMKDRAKELKRTESLIGKDFQERLKKDALEWAKSNVVGGVDTTKDRIDKEIDEKFGRKYDYDTLQAAQKFAGNKDHENAYFKHLQELRAKQHEQAWYRKVADTVMRRTADRLESNFMRKAAYEKDREPNLLGAIGINTEKGWNPLRRGRFTDIQGYKEGQEIYRDQLDKAKEDFAKGIEIGISGNISDAALGSAAQGVGSNLPGQKSLTVPGLSEGISIPTANSTAVVDSGAKAKEAKKDDPIQDSAKSLAKLNLDIALSNKAKLESEKKELELERKKLIDTKDIVDKDAKIKEKEREIKNAESVINDAQLEYSRFQ